MEDAKTAVARLCDEASEVSAHYVVYEDGNIDQLVDEDRRAWHAGRSWWSGNRDINSRSIGIEIVNGGHDFGLPQFPKTQIEALILLCRTILATHAIPAKNILGHSDIAPDRKKDPGEHFPWKALAEAGIGLWVEPEPVCEGACLALGDEGAAVSEAQRLFASLGYDTEDSGCYGSRMRSVVTAFQRHFRQERIDGVADSSTLKTARALLRKRLQS